MIQRHVFISGKVQGVGFRAATYVKADREFQNLLGFVRNLKDGRVEAVFTGSEKDVLAMVSWCRTGPSSAEVESLEVREESVDLSLGKFKIR